MPCLMLTEREPWCAAIAYGNYMQLNIPTTDWASSRQPLEFCIRFLNCLYSLALCWYPAYTLGVPVWSLHFGSLTMQFFQSNFRGLRSLGEGILRTQQKFHLYVLLLEKIYLPFLCRLRVTMCIRSTVPLSQMSDLGFCLRQNNVQITQTKVWLNRVR